MMQKVNDFSEHYPDMPNVAAVCVYPSLVPVTRAVLEKENGVNIAAVAACFPSSQSFIEVKVAETALTVQAGADEIDVVISIGKFFSGFHSEVYEELQELKAACGKAHLKVILESGALRSAVEIKQASVIAIAAGADFIKTSTGKMEPAATLEAAYVWCNQRILRKNRRQNWFQTCRWCCHYRRCREILHRCKYGIRRRMDEQQIIPFRCKPPIKQFIDKYLQ